MAQLAINGGKPVREKPFASWPSFAEDEIKAVESVLRSGKVNYWTGKIGRSFEKLYAEYCGRKYAVAVANGSLALELALVALGIGEGDEVITTPRTFIASAGCALLRGASPVFADVDPVSQTISPESIKKVITEKTKAIIPVHLAGWPCEMDRIMELAHKNGLKVIEDCAQAHGAKYNGKPIGSFGDAAAFSFCQDKIITTGGEGGMLLTDDENLWRKAWSFKDHGKDWDAVYNREHAPGFRWLHESVGTNWRMTEMQSAIGIKQLEKLDGWVEARRRNAAKLNECFRGLPGLRITEPDNNIYHSYYKYYCFVEHDKLKDGWNRDRIMQAVCAEGIPCYSGSCSEIYREKSIPQQNKPVSRLPVAKKQGETSLMFLVHPTLEEKQMADTCRAVTKIMSEAAL